MAIEQGRVFFTEDEIHKQDNCVFFAAADYVNDNFGLTLTRFDFDRFLSCKQIGEKVSGIPTCQIPSTLDHLLKPHSISVSNILFQPGLKAHYRRQLSAENLSEQLKIESFLTDERIMETSQWSFPFLILLSAGLGVSHVEYIKEMDNFNSALGKVRGDKGRMPLGFKLDIISSK